jgi:hypothetical protein
MGRHAGYWLRNAALRRSGDSVPGAPGAAARRACGRNVSGGI